MSIASTVAAGISYVGLLAKCGAYVVRARKIAGQVEKLRARYDERADSARYLSEAMTVLDVDEPTTQAYMEVARLSYACGGTVGAILSTTDELSAAAQSMEADTRALHGRMADANRSNSVHMAQNAFIERR
ncbi:hypothetical protein QIS99_30405 [Streptomyces sp. B-S-A8]|uniref:Uncharacterized protein n=1 Tax=Streptomyces solicavernae TaxID=3043614 RepID=A0ABT6S386_9ACTN|nr:hypothetical protein [Streptomyces sp. B-S-A8]MDI3390473.1 hypothetical protein [Streptomyces sp. B-S-A8]